MTVLLLTGHTVKLSNISCIIQYYAVVYSIDATSTLWHLLYLMYGWYICYCYMLKLETKQQLFSRFGNQSTPVPFANTAHLHVWALMILYCTLWILIAYINGSSYKSLKNIHCKVNYNNMRNTHTCHFWGTLVRPCSKRWLHYSWLICWKYYLCKYGYTGIYIAYLKCFCPFLCIQHSPYEQPH